MYTQTSKLGKSSDKAMGKATEVMYNSQLRQARLERHWSQLELADAIGTTRANISRWERHCTLPGPYFRQRLCDLFDTVGKPTRPHLSEDARIRNERKNPNRQ